MKKLLLISSLCFLSFACNNLKNLNQKDATSLDVEEIELIETPNHNAPNQAEIDSIKEYKMNLKLKN